MKAPLKIFLTSSLVIFMGAVALLWKINPIIESLRPQILGKLERVIDHKVEVASIDVKFFPEIRFEISSLLIGDGNAKHDDKSPNAAKQDALVGADSVKIAIPLSALLRGRAEINSIEVLRPVIHARRDNNGSVYVGPVYIGPGLLQDREGAAPNSAESSAQTPNTTAAPTPASKPSPTNQTRQSPSRKDEQLTLDKIHKITVRDATIVVIDESVSPTQTTTLTNLNIALEDITNLSSATIAAESTINLSGHLSPVSQGSANVGSNTGRLSINGTIATLASGQKTEATLKLQDLDSQAIAGLASAYLQQQIPLQISGPVSLESSLHVSDLTSSSVSLDLDLTHSTLTHRGFSKKSDTPLKLRIGGRLSIIGGQQTSISMNALPSFDPLNTIAFDLQNSSIQLGRSTISVSGTVPIREPQTATISISAAPLYFSDIASLESSLTIDGSANIKLQGSNLLNQPSVVGAISITDGSISKAPESWHISGVSNVSGTIEFTGDAIHMRDMQAKVNEQPVSLVMDANPIRPERISFNLRSPRIDLDRLMATSANNQGSNSRGKNIFSNISVRGSVELQPLAANLNIDCGECTASGLTVTQVKVPITATLPLNLKATGVSAEFFGGTLDLSSSVISASDVNHHFNASISLAGTDLKRFTQQVLPDSKYGISGTLQSLKATVAGETVDIKSTLTGPFTINISQGEISGINLLRDTLSAINSIPGVSGSLIDFIPKEHSGALESSGTVFSSVTGKSSFKSGGMNISNLELAHPLYSVIASGRAELSGGININAKLKLSPTLASGIIDRQKNLRFLRDKDGFIVIPVQIVKEDGGRVSCRPDINALLENASRSAVTDIAEKQLRKLDPGSGKTAKKLLDSLF